MYASGGKAVCLRAHAEAVVLAMVLTMMHTMRISITTDQSCTDADHTDMCRLKNNSRLAHIAAHVLLLP
jgi:hypothetical protein